MCLPERSLQVGSLRRACCGDSESRSHKMSAVTWNCSHLEVCGEAGSTFKVTHSWVESWCWLLMSAFSSSPPGLSTGCMSVPISCYQLPTEAIILEGKAKIAMVLSASDVTHYPFCHIALVYKSALLHFGRLHKGMNTKK